MKQWHCVNKKPALWSYPHDVFQTYVASFFTFSLHPCWLYVITSTLIIRQLCYGPTHVEHVGRQTQNRLVQNAPTGCLQQVDILQNRAGRRRGSNVLLPPLLGASWMISCQGCTSAWKLLDPSHPLEAEAEPFKSVLYSKMLCYYLRLPVCLLSFMSWW